MSDMDVVSSHPMCRGTQAALDLTSPAEHPAGKDLCREKGTPADQYPSTAGTSTAYGYHSRRWRDTQTADDQHGGRQTRALGMDCSLVLQPANMASLSVRSLFCKCNGWASVTWARWPWGRDPWAGRRRAVPLAGKNMPHHPEVTLPSPPCAGEPCWWPRAGTACKVTTAVPRPWGWALDEEQKKKSRRRNQGRKSQGHVEAASPGGDKEATQRATRAAGRQLSLCFFKQVKFLVSSLNSSSLPIVEVSSSQ